MSLLTPARLRPLLPDEREVDSRDLRDILDRVIDKGIVVDPGDRIALLSDEPLDRGERIVVGLFHADLDRAAQITRPGPQAKPRSG